MSDRHGHGLTTMAVGFFRAGYFVEGAHCPHLSLGETAHGYTSDRPVEGGFEVTLMCKACYELYVVKRGAEAVNCNDCNTQVPRSQTQQYTPYDREGLSVEEATLTICLDCLEEERHLDRLADDRGKAVDDAGGDDAAVDLGLGRDFTDAPLTALALGIEEEEELECSDCGNEFPKSTLKDFVPFDRGDASIADCKLHLCSECLEDDRHQGRLQANRLDAASRFR